MFWWRGGRWQGAPGCEGKGGEEADTPYLTPGKFELVVGRRGPAVSTRTVVGCLCGGCGGDASGSARGTRLCAVTVCAFLVAREVSVGRWPFLCDAPRQRPRSVGTFVQTGEKDHLLVEGNPSKDKPRPAGDEYPGGRRRAV